MWNFLINRSFHIPTNINITQFEICASNCLVGTEPLSATNKLIYIGQYTL